METQDARREVELLVVAGIIRDVHLTVATCYRSVFLKHDSGVVIEAGSTPLEKRGDQHHATLLGQRTVDVGGRPGDRLGKIEIIDTLYLTEV